MLGGRSHRLSVSGETTTEVYVRQVTLSCMSMDVRGQVQLTRCVQACNEQTKRVLHPVHHLQCTALMRRGTRRCKAVLVLTFLRRRPSPLASPRERSRCTLPSHTKSIQAQRLQFAVAAR
jgi:hypothetical protein